MMLRTVRRFFGAAPHVPRLPDNEVRRLYPRYRFSVMEATYLGYASFYLVRNNLSPVAKDLQGALGYSDNQLGNIMAAAALSYGLGKFVMGAVSDRCNPRVFMACGLLLTGLCNFAFGACADYHAHLVLWTLNGFFQGMGWPPCGRLMGHWFSERERGLSFSIWNTAHNVGGGIAGVLAAGLVKEFGAWQYSFFVPGVLAIIGSFYLFWRLCDTPQSVGLPPIEEYNNDYPENHQPEHQERDLTTRELLFKYVLTNKYIWLLAIANFFCYIARYSMLDWGPKYLREVKGASVLQGGNAVAILEFGGILPTILLGWWSDRLAGRRGMVAVLCMIPILAAFAVISMTPAGYLWLDMAMLCTIGLLIYPVINFLVIMALDLTSKKAIGTAAGFIGLAGYVGRAVQAKGAGWMLTHFKATHGLEEAWRLVLLAMLAGSTMAVILLAFTWRWKPRA